MNASPAAVAPPAFFTLPPELAATEPPEERGLARDGVRLLVAGPEGLQHMHFHNITRALRPGDLVVVNTSATLPAALDGCRAGGEAVTVHLSAPLDDGTWVIELRSPNGSDPFLEADVGESIELPGGARLRLVEPDGRSLPGKGTRLWRANVIADAPIELYLSRHGRPISYSYVQGAWPLSAFQTIFATEPGSAEMPCAGRPFTPLLITELVRGGITVAPLLLHTGVSSLEAGELPQPERYRVPPTTAALVNLTRRTGGRVIAIGTTVTRALETVADPGGTIAAGEGWTDLVLGSDHPARTVDAIVTGWHAPDAPHLSLLEAVAGADLVRKAYDEALQENYLWHEFGDSCLLIRDPG